LGLPVSQKIMREHGGRIAVESEPGRGATFILEMPAVLADVTRDVGSDISKTYGV
jgi:signal transduction histidine kinase